MSTNLHFITSAEMIAIMDGHPPPPTYAPWEQREGYFTILEERAADRYGADLMPNFHLLAGMAPEEWNAHSRARHDRIIATRLAEQQRTTRSN